MIKRAVSVVHLGALGATVALSAMVLVGCSSNDAATTTSVAPTTAAASASVTTAAGAVGGGGGAADSAKADLITKADAICTDTQKKAAAVAPQSLTNVGPSMQQLVSITRDGITQLKALTPPAAEAAAYGEVIAKMTKRNDDLELKIPAISQNPTAMIGDATLTADDAAITTAATAFGFQVCGAAATT